MAARKKAPETSAIELEIDGEKCSLDFETLTLGEVEEIEVYFGRPMGQITEEEWNTGRGTLLMAYLALHRKRPATTLDDVRRIQINKVGEAPEERPTKDSKEPETSGGQS